MTDWQFLNQKINKGKISTASTSTSSVVLVYWYNIGKTQSISTSSAVFINISIACFISLCILPAHEMQAKLVCQNLWPQAGVLAFPL